MDLFNSLLKLGSFSEYRTPLEDFTTKILAGILNSNHDIKRKFIQDFLQLKNDEYSIHTHSYHELKNDSNCIIDLKIEGENTICFIENKINSFEGPRQLDRYSLVLDGYRKNTHLIYCTKFMDEKSITNHNFRQVRWFQIATFFQQFREDSLVKYFLEFLKTNNMAHELTLNVEDFIVFANMQKTINFVKECLNGAKSDFKKNFSGNGKSVSDKVTLDQILRHDRMVYMYDKILPGEGWSEIKYGFRFSQPSIFVDIYLDNKNDHYIDFRRTLKDMTMTIPFTLTEHTLGGRFAIEFDISRLLNNENAVSEIIAWFKDTFTKFKDAINKSPELNWRISA
jgi:hypothetical protein